MAKTKAQLNREIAAALARRKPKGFSPGDPNNDAFLRHLDDFNDPPRTALHRAAKADRSHATLKKPTGKGKTSTKIDVDRLVKMLGLPEWDDIDERNADYYHQAARGAEDEDAAADEVRDELFGKWYDAVTGVAERLFGEHGLELDPIGKGSKAPRPYYFKVVPKTNWNAAADKIRETINGVGYFHFNNLREFLDSGPYTATQAVLGHLGSISDYPSVYGGSSARSMYDQAMR